MLPGLTLGNGKKIDAYVNGKFYILISLSYIIKEMIQIFGIDTSAIY